MARHLLMRLEAPLVAFGGETIDSHGVIRDFPALSMVTGLLANALGWRREDADHHDRLQTRLLMGARIESANGRLRDYQTALLYENDQGWTTRGIPEGRAKSPSYRAGPDGRKALTLQRYRDYHADLRLLLVLRLEPADEEPTLGDLAAALDRPARPLFLGRKPCLPSRRLFAGWQEGKDLLEALCAVPLPADCPTHVRLQWPDGEGRMAGDRLLDLCDERNWASGVHGGWRPIRQGAIHAAEQGS